MSDQNLFNTPSDEIKRLIEELRGTKDALREVSRALSQIETRMRRSFPSLFPKQMPVTRASKSISEQPKLTVEEAMNIYGQLVASAKKGDHHFVQEQLNKLELADLNLLRRELGASIGKKKPSRKVLEEAILGRVKESVLLTRHADRGRIIEQGGGTTSDPRRDSEPES